MRFYENLSPSERDRAEHKGGFKYGLGHPNPTEEIIRRYRELGGEIITIGADAHKPEHVAFDFAKSSFYIKKTGFDYFTVFRGESRSL